LIYLRRDVFEAPLITVKSSLQIHVDPFYALQVLVVHVAQEVVLAAVVAGEEEVAVALVEDFGSDDGQVDAIPDRRDLADQGAQIQDPSVEVHVVAFAEVDLGVVRRLLVGKGLCSHQIVAAAGAVAAELDAVDVVDVGFADAVDAVGAVGAAGAAGADDVAGAELVVVQQSVLHAVTCIEHELRQHDGVLQPVLLLHELCPLLLLLYGGPTIPPYS
jgi:hypothetical protein